MNILKDEETWSYILKVRAIKITLLKVPKAYLFFFTENVEETNQDIPGKESNH